jgi:hypothetical protein
VTDYSVHFKAKDTADYIAELLLDLRQMAQKSDLQMLAYMLDMAREQARQDVASFQKDNDKPQNYDGGHKNSDLRL